MAARHPIWKGLSEGVDQLARMLWPGRCVSCGALLLENESLACGRCADNIQAAGDVTVDPPLDAAWAAFSYDGPVRDAMQAWKYTGREAVGRTLCQRYGAAVDGLLRTALPVAATLRAASAIVPVPLHPRRIRKRGFDQTARLARTTAALLPSATLTIDGLRRERDTVAQASLDRDARLSNMTGAFRAHRAFQGTIVVVDDVVTTGATASACASALRAAGATEVVLLAVAHAHDDRYDGHPTD